MAGIQSNAELHEIQGLFTMRRLTVNELMSDFALGHVAWNLSQVTRKKKKVGRLNPLPLKNIYRAKEWSKFGKAPLKLSRVEIVVSFTKLFTRCSFHRFEGVKDHRFPNQVSFRRSLDLEHLEAYLNRDGAEN